MTCTKDERPAAGEGNQIAVTTSSVTNVTDSSALLTGALNKDGGQTIVEAGFCWSVNEKPTLVDSIVSIKNFSGSSFSTKISGLTPGTKYYLRAYVKSLTEVVYGNEVDLRTLILPVLTTSPVINITQSGATSGGNITSDGGIPIVSRGVCWNTIGSPTTANSITINGSGIGNFSSSITNLLPLTTYYVRAYATNSVGTSYGNEIHFTATSIPAVVTTSNVSSITSSTALLGGNVVSDGGAQILSRGVCWNKTGLPTIANSITQEGTGLGIFTSTLGGLVPATTYYVRAYVTTTNGTAYGNEIVFTTSFLPVSLTTSAITSVTSSSALSGGNITSDGGTPVTAKGICWNTTGLPTTANSFVQNGSGLGNFSANLTDLRPSTIYYVRAYAISAAGTFYGNEISFITSSPPAAITTTGISSITGSTAQSGGNITSDGGSTVISRGVCWNTTGSPTITNSTTQNGSGVGSFTSTLSGLLSATTYYVRAYMTTSAGTTYGNEVLFYNSATTPEVCNISTNTTGTLYSMLTPVGGSVFYAGDGYTITMSSPVYNFGQATSVSLFKNEVEVFSYGSYLVFADSPGNTRTFMIPGGLTTSTCYTIRVHKAEGSTPQGNPIDVIYVSPKFEIR